MLQYKKTNLVFIAIFLFLIIAPFVTLNNKADAISEIDNRKLADSPRTKFGTSEFAPAVNSYLNDRIGFRNEYIKWYEKAHDEIFNMLIHPSYMYGKNKEVFLTVDLCYFDDTNYLDDFADFTKGMQDYCKKRGTQFVFQWEPDKSAIRTDLLPAGLNYDPSWTEYLFNEFDKRSINYVDNMTLFRELEKKGVFLYNHKYDAGHFNDNGGYYSCNNVLENLHETNPAIHVNEKSEINFGVTNVEKLLQSDFTINEDVPSNIPKAVDEIVESKEFTEDYYIDPPTRVQMFTHFENKERNKERAPRALIFGGSHMGSCYKYYANSFSECLIVPNYTNVVNYEYYIDKFNPDVVIFEMGQRTIGEAGFPIHNKEALKANIDAFEAERVKEH